MSVFCEYRKIFKFARPCITVLDPCRMCITCWLIILQQSDRKIFRSCGRIIAYPFLCDRIFSGYADGICLLILNGHLSRTGFVRYNVTFSVCDNCYIVRISLLCDYIMSSCRKF